MIQFKHEIQSPKQLSPGLNSLLAGLVLLLATGAVLLNFHLTMIRHVDGSMRNSLRREALACAMTVCSGYWKNRVGRFPSRRI